ncbi:MFS transporter [Paenibacillus sp. SI8]|uniref:MFS transporter n=1 Tax=unclassified Paenibacillus TaxID=185978 RepID=UPI003465DEE4
MTDSTNPIRSLLSNRFVQIIIASNVLIQLGIWIRNFAVLLFVMEKTNGNPIAVSLISVAEFAPIFAFSILAGTFSDRWEPKRTLIGSDFLSALSIFAVLISMLFGSWKTIFIVTLMSSILSQFSAPAGMKLFKTHVSEQLLQSGMSLYQSINAMFVVFGPILGTFIYQQFGIYVAVGIICFTFLLSAGILTLLPVKREFVEEKALTTVWKDMKQGIQYVISNKTLRTIGGCFMVTGLALGLIQPLLIFLVTDRLQLPKEYLKWLMTADGVAMIIGTVLAMGLSRKVSPQQQLLVGMICISVALLGFGISTQLWLTLLFQVICGLVLPCIQISINTMTLQNTEETYIGRVNGLLTSMYMGSMMITMSVSGWFMHVFSLVIIFSLSALFCIIGATVVVPLLRKPSNHGINQPTSSTP